MMIIKLNEHQVEITEGTTLFELKSETDPSADIIIYNGHQVSTEQTLEDGDQVFFITRGAIPSESEMEQYLMARHTPGIHDKLKNGSVAIAGIGGLGSNIAVSLARMGVGHIKLVDFDVVEPSNINRQYFFLDQLGMTKTTALHETLQRVNPYIQYSVENTFVTENNINDIFKGFDIVIESFDKAETKAMFIRHCMQHFKESLIIGASGVAGAHDTASLEIRKLGKNTYIVGDCIHEAKPGEGLMATRVTVAANIQANIAVRHLLEEL